MVSSRNLAVNSFPDVSLYSQETVSENHLTFKDKVYLSLLMNPAVGEDVMMISPTFVGHGMITPTKTYLESIIHHLVERNILLTEDVSVPRKRGQYRRAYIPNITSHWHKINIEPADDVENFVKRMQFLEVMNSENYIEDAYDLWLEIACYELFSMIEQEAQKFKVILPEQYWECDENIKSIVKYYSLAQLRTAVVQFTDLYLKRHLNGEITEKELVQYLATGIFNHLREVVLNNELPNLTMREPIGMGSSFMHILFFKQVCGFTDSIYTLKPSKSVLEILQMNALESEATNEI